MRRGIPRGLAAAISAITIAALAGPALAADASAPVPAWVRNRPTLPAEPATSAGSTRVSAMALPSPVGTLILNRQFFDGNAWGAAEVWTTTTKLSGTGVGDGDLSPTWSPGGTRIAFDRDQTSSTVDAAADIWVMNANGTGQQRLTNTATDDILPAWSPDGHRIAFATNRDGNYEVYTMKRDGTDLRRLTFNSAIDTQPAWSPDGTKIAFVSDRANGDADVWIMNADGTGATNYSNTNGLDILPWWSPDGTKIAWSSGRFGTFGELGILVAPSNSGSTVTQLTDSLDGNNIGAAWSPDGAWILFDNDDVTASDNIGIWAVPSNDSGAPDVLFDTSAADYDVEWQPEPDFPLVDARFSQFELDIEWLFGAGITSGCTAELFCPDDNVTRGQMAAFLARALSLPNTATDYFGDDDGTLFETDINRLAAAGITTGCTPGNYCPNANVTRGQMAAFLARAYSLPSTATDYFTDDASSGFEIDINRLAASGITSGCTPTTYCPSANVTRGQMAAFLNRAEN